MNKLIYLDNAATTRTAKEVVDKMMPYFEENYGNPSSIYTFADKAKKGVEKARDIIASAIGAKSSEIYFTGGGSESDNWALKGIAESYKDKGRHIITTPIENHAILHTCRYLEKNGYDVTYVNVDENGMVKPDELEEGVGADTILI